MESRLSVKEFVGPISHIENCFIGEDDGGWELLNWKIQSYDNKTENYRIVAIFRARL